MSSRKQSFPRFLIDFGVRGKGVLQLAIKVSRALGSEAREFDDRRLRRLVQRVQAYCCGKSVRYWPDFSHSVHPRECGDGVGSMSEFMPLYSQSPCSCSSLNPSF